MIKYLKKPLIIRGFFVSSRDNKMQMIRVIIKDGI